MDYEAKAREVNRRVLDAAVNHGDPEAGVEIIATALRKAVRVKQEGCPFCGDTNWQQTVSAVPAENAEQQVWCDNCGARGPVGKDHDEANVLWKRRALSGEK